jgi:hypothetical protein
MNEIIWTGIQIAGILSIIWANLLLLILVLLTGKFAGELILDKIFGGK